MTVASPCIKLCRIEQTGFCAGCFRTLDEIARWAQLDAREKLAINRLLADRQSETGAVERSGENGNA